VPNKSRAYMYTSIDGHANPNTKKCLYVFVLNLKRQAIAH